MNDEQMIDYVRKAVNEARSASRSARFARFASSLPNSVVDGIATAGEQYEGRQKLLVIAVSGIVADLMGITSDNEVIFTKCRQVAAALFMERIRRERPTLQLSLPTDPFDDADFARTFRILIGMMPADMRAEAKKRHDRVFPRSILQRFRDWLGEFSPDTSSLRLRAEWREIQVQFGRIKGEIVAIKGHYYDGGIEWEVYPADCAMAGDAQEFYLLAERAGKLLRRMSHPSKRTEEAIDQWLNVVSNASDDDPPIPGFGKYKSVYTTNVIERAVRASMDTCARLAEEHASSPTSVSRLV